MSKEIPESAIELAYGENRCQSPAWLEPDPDNNDPLALHLFQDLGAPPSYITIADGDQVLDVLCLLAEAFRRWKNKEPYIVVAGKHGNPCGIGVDFDDPVVAISKAMRGDTTAVMGGEVITNFAISGDCATALYEADGQLTGRGRWGLDVVFAPEMDADAVDILGKLDSRRLLVNTALFHATMPVGLIKRQVRGGVLVQQRSQFVLSPDQVVSQSGYGKVDDDSFTDQLIAWAACWRASSNTVALAKDGMLIGLGCGQQDRIACVELCVWRAKRAGHDMNGSQFASDAFFPYAKNNDPSIKEGPQILAEIGCAGGVVPADGKNFEEVKQFFSIMGMTVSFVAKENRGFSKH